MRGGDKRFLLVTLDKSAAADEHKYKDEFLGLNIFQWQSQNRTTQVSSDGKSIKEHAGQGITFFLFVRPQSKTRDGKAMPFVFCGPVEFVGWDGERPITVHWRLQNAVPERLHVGIEGAKGLGFFETKLGELAHHPAPCAALHRAQSVVI